MGGHPTATVAPGTLKDLAGLVASPAKQDALHAMTREGKGDALNIMWLVQAKWVNIACTRSMGSGERMGMGPEASNMG